MSKFSRVLITSLLAVFALAVVAPAALAQNTITLTITAPEWMSDTFTDDVFADFEAQNPGVNVVFVLAGDSMYYGGAAFSPEDHLDNVEQYANKADVLYVDSWNTSVDATRAGYFLDLSPLVTSDPGFDSSDFFPAVWQSFQWDNGIWALPISANLNVLIYKPAAFDEAGLAYPNESWTLEDFLNAAEALSRTNSRGEVTVPGFPDWGTSTLLIRALLGHGFYDDSTFPAVPSLQDPALEAMLAAWGEAQQAGYTGSNFNGSSQELPMRIEGLWSLSNNMRVQPGDETEASLLPGGVAGLSVQGLAVSRGTQNPELAYALAKYLTENVQVVNRFFGDTPARRSMVGAEDENSTMFRPELPPEVEEFRDHALENALPTSEMRFSDYITVALMSMSSDGDNLDAFTALQEAENNAITNLQVAADRRATINVFVAGPTPTPVLSAGEVAIKFTLGSNVSPLPNRQLWEQTIQQFVADDPQIGQITLETGFGGPEQFIENGADCFYVPWNAVPNLELASILNLDPFMNADPAFDQGDLIGGALAKVRRDDMTWAYPLTVQPEILWYNSTLFDEAGVPYPSQGWTVEQFNDALSSLKLDPEDEEPFSPGYGNSYILLLAAAYGGVPLDYRTDPPTVNFDDPATMDALRQVLDLAKGGYIKYTRLGDFSGGGAVGQQALYNETLSPLSWRLQQINSSSEYQDPYRITAFPRGTQYTGVAYEIGTGFISATSANPEPCYRWLSYLAEHPELFTALPVRRSAIDSFAASVSQGDALLSLYDEIDTLLQDPNTIPIATQSGGGLSLGSWILPVWLNRAMDAYVLDGGDLEAELSDAQIYADLYAECIGSIPNMSAAEVAALPEAEMRDYYEQYTDCAIRVDPRLETLFNFGTSSDE